MYAAFCIARLPLKTQDLKLFPSISNCAKVETQNSAFPPSHPPILSIVLDSIRLMINDRILSKNLISFRRIPSLPMTDWRNIHWKQIYSKFPGSKLKLPGKTSLVGWTCFAATAIELSIWVNKRKIKAVQHHQSRPVRICTPAAR